MAYPHPEETLPETLNKKLLETLIKVEGTLHIIHVSMDQTLEIG